MAITMSKRTNDWRRFGWVGFLHLVWVSGCGTRDDSAPIPPPAPAAPSAVDPTASAEQTLESMAEFSGERLPETATPSPKASTRGTRGVALPEHDRASLDRLQAELRAATTLTIHYPPPTPDQTPPDALTTVRKTLAVDDPETLRELLDTLIIEEAWEEEESVLVSDGRLSASLTLTDGSRVVLDFRRPDEAVRHWWGSLKLDAAFYSRLCELASEAEGTPVDPASELLDATYFLQPAPDDL